MYDIMVDKCHLYDYSVTSVMSDDNFKYPEIDTVAKAGIKTLQ